MEAAKDDIVGIGSKVSDKVWSDGDFRVHLLTLWWDVQSLRGLCRSLYLYQYSLYLKDVDAIDCCSHVGPSRVWMSNCLLFPGLKESRAVWLISERWHRILDLACVREIPLTFLKTGRWFLLPHGKLYTDMYFCQSVILLLSDDKK